MRYVGKNAVRLVFPGGAMYVASPLRITYCSSGTAYTIPSVSGRDTTVTLSPVPAASCICVRASGRCSACNEKFSNYLVAYKLIKREFCWRVIAFHLKLIKMNYVKLR